MDDLHSCDALELFLQAFNRPGLTQWEGIEQDIEWGHVTSLMGLARPSIDGPIFIYRAPCRLGGQSPHRVRLMATTGSGPVPLAVIAVALAQGRLGSNPGGQVVCRNV